MGGSDTARPQRVDLLDYFRQEGRDTDTQDCTDPGRPARWQTAAVLLARVFTSEVIAAYVRIPGLTLT